MRTKDWKAINNANVLVVGEDSNLQWSETVPEYVMFADYYFRSFPEDHGERSRNASELQQITKIITSQHVLSILESNGKSWVSEFTAKYGIK